MKAYSPRGVDVVDGVTGAVEVGGEGVVGFGQGVGLEEGGGEGAGFEVVGVEAEIGGQLLGAVFAAVGGGVGGVGEGQSVGVVLGVLLPGALGGVYHADDIALVVGDVGVVDAVGGDVAFGSLVAVELFVCELGGTKVVTIDKLKIH